MTRLSSHCHHLTHALRSLCFNELGVKGASAIAAVLKETMITDLKCAAAPGCSLSCERPLTCLQSHRQHLPRSLSGNFIGDEGITELCEGLKGSAVTSLECADAP